MTGEKEQPARGGDRQGGDTQQPSPQAATNAERRDTARPGHVPHFPIVAIGASAGGLDAAAKFFDAMPPDSGMAFIFVQHLDPNHESLMAELLGTHTGMRIRQAEDGMAIEPDQVYVCPPGQYLGVRFGMLHLSQPEGNQHTRLPIDFLVRSLAVECGSRAICMILSGTGTDGSGALAALHEGGGYIVAQDPDEAEYDGMPRSAILTGLVNAIAPAAQMPSELAKIAEKMGTISPGSPAVLPDADMADIMPIITLLQRETGHDFRAYKRGTLTRRMQRRMGLRGLTPYDFSKYQAELEGNIEERRQLAEDLLINVTSFFRDPSVFEVLERDVIPELIRSLEPDQALRIWCVGCSTGEEAYTLAMICRDAIIASGRDIKFQVFASDIDAQAIAAAREGTYPLSIEDEIPADRLARYFLKEEKGFRVASVLRGAVVFTLQDVLHDPPFSRINLVSCRNLLIYLKSEAQAKVISLFHFALREGGILLLGSAETTGSADDRFEVLHKVERIYRHAAQSRVGEPGFPLSFVESIPRLSAQESRQQLSRQAMLADLCRDQVVDSFAPASVLINNQRQCVYSLGPVSRYLRVATGLPTLDLLAMAPPDLRATLRYAIARATSKQPDFKTRICTMEVDGQPISFTVQVRFLATEGEDLHLVSFVEEANALAGDAAVMDETSQAQIRELERELEVANAELQRAMQSRDVLVLEQRSINDEALLVNEEFQSTNEELLTSKEELQSLNEELIVLNSQLQETLDRQRITSDDLQNVLYSTNVATLFLDSQLRIRFFTPATRAIFNVIPGDVGRPLSDLHSRAADESLLGEARLVLEKGETIEREISAAEGTWFLRRIFPYRTYDNHVEGVVITFIDITDPRRTTEALELAVRKADASNRAKTRFLSVASHDLRQPLQSLRLIQDLLRQSVSDEPARELVMRLDQSLETMTRMLDSLLDINQLEAGLMETTFCRFPIAGIFERLDLEFGLLAMAQGLELHIVPSSAEIYSDPQLLEEMLRNLLANALKYTRTGKILLGCRHESNAIRIEVWDTGIGIAAAELSRIFDEFYQVDNAARERSLGFGLGLSIVKHLGHLLGVAVKARSWPDEGSVFSITVPIDSADATAETQDETKVLPARASAAANCAIIIVEDDPDNLELLARLLTNAGHSVMVAQDGPTALKVVADGAIRPEIVLTDFSLPGGMTGVEVITAIRSHLQDDVPGIILTGNISTDVLAGSPLESCLLLNKPVSLPDLHAAIAALAPAKLRKRQARVTGPDVRRPQIICIVDDNPEIRDSLRAVLEHDDRPVAVFPSAEAFLADHVAERDLCLIVDITLPGMSGIALIEHLRQNGDPVPAILITGSGDIAMAVQAIRSGASDFIEKPVSRSTLIDSIDRAVAQLPSGPARGNASREVAARLEKLTARQKAVLDLVLAGHPSKNIAADLGISQRTVESHRAHIMQKLGVRTIPDLVRAVLSAPPV